MASVCPPYPWEDKEFLQPALEDDPLLWFGKFSENYMLLSTVKSQLKSIVLIDFDDELEKFKECEASLMSNGLGKDADGKITD